MITNQNQQYQTNRSYDLSRLKGTGENNGRWLDDVTGVLVSLEPRVGADPYYEWDNPVTGEHIRKPQSWTARFADGSLFSWPTYEDENTHEILPWDRFDPSIDLAYCAQNNIAIRVWRDKRKFTHLTLAEGESVSVNTTVGAIVAQPMSQQTRQPVQPPMQQQPMQQQPQYYQPMQQQYYGQPQQNGAPF